MLINRSLKQVKNSVLAKGYKFFDHSVNLIGERTTDTFTNEFTDMLHVCYFDHDTQQQKILTIPFTTKAGTFGKDSVTDPVLTTGFNIVTKKLETLRGTGSIVEGQYEKVWRFIDNYTTWLSYPFMMQEGPFNVYRDGNKDLIMDRNVPIHRGVFGINLHRMSAVGQSTGILSAKGSNPWSVACQGAPEAELKKLLPILRADSKLFGNMYTYTLLQTKDMINV